ncbi:MAG: cobalt ECF transporter T component CbiQ [Candidatus Omnitrophica bacterium]|nr:cobalt ECF transporter T component CbiQ [Candidatus Omnitrophota bacterium]MBU4303009.1 cobalt ECF transporter T component CbiQ [Candidatus Omnitrophota bacterium]MBU4418335.1 cobalt ECF transporter T component CbiQ [Candidatus Omnitrophota bacterium]MBU4468379.1 cobalt ECF transporter T component CbiQ [Candidatus Omnitrophota bacterium]MCG2708336.1 cobalt ECF transporter T component CbiQ [Candidatus Omnitrophota bacterium]
MKSNNFIERSIVGGLTFLKDSIFAEEVAQRGGFLQSLDVRVKIISFLLFILQALFTGSIPALLFLYALCLFLGLISRIELVFFLKRTWFFIPLFSLGIAFPAIFGPGEPLLSWQILGAKFSITHQGLQGAVVFVIRVITCVSFVVLLNITTRHFDLLKVLRIFKIPAIFIMILGMCYRYIYLFAGIIQNTYLAIKSRVGRGVQYQQGQGMVAWNIASLWDRSVGLNEEVYKAMLSRGYQGEALAWNDFKIRTKDWLWLFAVILLWIILFLN